VKQNLVVSIAAIGGMFVCGVCWLLLPRMQDSQRRVDDDAALHLETARRLLHKYSFGLEHKSLLLDGLAELDVDVDVEDPDALVEEEDAADEYQARHEERWKVFEPTEWSESPTPARANYGNLPRQISEGIDLRIDLIDENQEWLDQAFEEVEQALSLSANGASSRSYAEAKRLKGMILYQQGLAERLAAMIKRTEAAPYRQSLISLAHKVGTLESKRTLAVDSGIDEQIAHLAGTLSQSRTQLRREQENLTKLEVTIQDFQNRIALAETRAEQARANMSELQARGIDFSDPSGPATFNEGLVEHDRVYRDAAREVRALTVGYYPNAQIDHTRDYLRGRYVEDGSPTDLTVKPGLRHWLSEQAVLAANIRGQQHAIEGLTSDISRLEGMKAAFEQVQADAARETDDVVKSAADVYAELARVEAEAEAIEEDALDLLGESASTAAQAAVDAKRWVTDARERTRGLSPEAKARSALGKRTTDDWTSGSMAAEEADARIAMAQIYYWQYDAHRQDAVLLETVSGVLRLKEADVEDLRVNADEARDAGVEEVTKALEQLEQAHSAMDRHWTLVAQEAGALYLLSQFGDSAYVADAVDAYRSALKGREDAKEVEKFATRLKRLESR